MPLPVVPPPREIYATAEEAMAAADRIYPMRAVPPESRTDAATAVGGGAWEPRVDRGALLAAHVRPDGTLLVEGYAARAGVLVYRRDGMEIRELVTTDTLAAAARGLGRTVVTLDHPSHDAYPQGVTPDNVAALQVGDTDGEVTVEDGGFVRVRLAVRRRDAVDAVRAGKRELSPGYAVRLDPTPGVDPVHGRYDARQIERVYNHLAIVDQARGGPEVRMRADAAVAVDQIYPGVPPAARADVPATGATVKPGFIRLFTLLGITSRVDNDDAAIEAACAALDQRKDAREREATAHTTALAAANTRADTEKARADTATAKVATLEAAEAARLDAAARIELDALATALGLDPKASPDTKALRKAIATKHLGSELAADATDAYIAAHVDMARADMKDRGDGREAGRRAWQATAPEVAAHRGDAPVAKTKKHDRWGGQPVPRGGE